MLLLRRSKNSKLRGTGSNGALLVVLEVVSVPPPELILLLLLPPVVVAPGAESIPVSAGEGEEGMAGWEAVPRSPLKTLTRGSTDMDPQGLRSLGRRGITSWGSHLETIKSRTWWMVNRYRTSRHSIPRRRNIACLCAWGRTCACVGECEKGARGKGTCVGVLLSVRSVAQAGA